MTTLTDLRRRQFLGKSPKDFINNPWLPKEKQSDRIHSNYSVIKLNSTYVETVDDGYANRGFGAMTGLVLGSIMLFFTGLMCWLEIRRGSFPLFFLALGVPAALMGYWVSRFECLANTHYPIRYNRKNRCVYSWRPKGKTIKANWDDLCFFPMPRYIPTAEHLIVAAILSADKQKIEDVFFLGVEGGDTDQNKMYIEFLRCFMNQGLEELLKHPIAFQPRLDQHKESFWHGWRQIMLNLNGQVLFQLVLSPFLTLQSLFRFIAMRTSKIPVWPEWVEAECQVDPHDPWVRDVSTNPVPTE